MPAKGSGADRETMYAVERHTARKGWIDMGQWFRSRERAEAYIAQWKEPSRGRVVEKSVGPVVGSLTVRF